MFRARRAGRLYALKFLSLALSARAWRELEVHLKLRYVGSVALLGHGLWPDSGPCFLFLVMPYVHGRPLYACAKEKNLTAREVALLMLELVRQVVEIHREGVVHRDIKGSNVLVRHEDGRPVLVDFGLGTWAGASEITNPLGLPGTRYYRGPEALRFRREHAGEQTPPRHSDDLWALGVLVYVLLTGRYPFTTEVPDEGALANVILYEEPEPPHVRNPHVPRAMSELCLRMLEKHREARYPDAVAVGAELEEVLEEAGASWDEPLRVAWHLDDAPPPWVSVSPRKRAPLRRVLAWGGAVLVLGLVGLLATTPKVVAVPDTAEVRKTGQEVAPADKPPEGGRGAAPEGAATPAPVASATPPKDSKRVRTPKQAPRSQKKQQEKQSTLLDSSGKVCVLVWTAGHLACVSPATEVRPMPLPLPPPAECPPGSLETMKELGLRVGDEKIIEFHLDPKAPSETITVHATPDIKVRQGGSWKGLPIGTVFSGELFLSTERVHGRFTQAHLPDGRTLPVCLVLLDDSGTPGVKTKPGSGWNVARIHSAVDVRVVDHFERVVDRVE